MKALYLALILLLGAACTQTALGQKRTIEKRAPVDSTTTIVVTETEDITPRHRILIVNPIRFFVPPPTANSRTGAWPTSR